MFPRPAFARLIVWVLVRARHQRNRQATSIECRERRLREKERSLQPFKGTSFASLTFVQMKSTG